MSNFTPSSSLDDVPMFLEDTLLLGGDSSAPMNAPLQALLNRLEHHKANGETDPHGIGAAIAAAIAALTKASVGLGNVDNTADANKPVSTAQAEAIAVAVAGIVNSSPAALDTLNEIAAALGNDENFAATMVAALAGKGGLASNNTWTKAQRGAFVALTSTSASIAVDLALSNNFNHTLTENTTLEAPTHAVAGQSGVIEFTQHASSPKTLALNSFWKFPGGAPSPVLTATNGAIDVMTYVVASTGTYAICSMGKAVA